MKKVNLSRNLLVIFAFLILGITCENNSLITLNLTKESGMLVSSVEIGDPPQKISLLLDLLSNATFLAGSKCAWFYGYVAQNVTVFFEDKSTSLKKSLVIAESRKETSRFQAQGDVYFDSFNLGIDVMVQNNSFVISNNYISDIPVNGVIGLDKGVPEEGQINKNSSVKKFSLSLLENLYNEKLITKKVFFINNTKNTLNFGNYPNNFNETSYNYSTCSSSNLTYENTFVINSHDRVNSHWMCKVLRVFTGEVGQLNAIIFDKIALFSSTITGMLISSDFLTFFERNFFYGFKLNNCFKTERGNTFVFSCLRTFNISLLPSLNFEIDDWVYTFKPESLFSESIIQDYYYETASPETKELELEKTHRFFKIRFVNKQKFNMFYSVIGIDMFEDTIVFDKENDQIGFTTKSKIHRNNLIFPSPGMGLVILLVIIIGSFFGFVVFMILGYVCYINIKDKRERVYHMELSHDVENEDHIEIKQL